MNLNFPKRIGALLLGVVLATAGCSDGSKTTTVTTLPGTITGIVKKGTAPVAGVVVTPDPATGPAVTTGLDGRYRLAVLPGSYALTFTGDNLEPATASATVGAGETVTLDQTMTASALQVTVTVPDALRFGGPAGFDTTVEGITATAKIGDETVSSPEVTWKITDYYGLSSPPAAAEPSPATGATTSFSIADFETVRQGANTWLNARYGLTGDDRIEYIQTPPRHQLLSFGPEQVRAMSFKVTASVRVGSRTATGSALVAPVTISSGGNTQPLGMMVVGNAPPPAAGETASYAWSLTYLPSTATTGTEFGAPPEGVVLKGEQTKNPYVVPTTAGVYKLANGANELLFRVSTFHGAGSADTDLGTDGVACVDCHDGEHALTAKFDEWRGSAHANHNWKDPFAEPMTLIEFELRDTSPDAHYSENCVSCHTVGYSKVPTANNKGFDDEAAASSPPWTFPTTRGPDAWATIDTNPALKHRAGMQCESCHGPLEPTDHGSVGAYRGLAIDFGTVAPASSMDAGTCNVCHDSFSHHDRSALWAASGHANTQLAMDEGAASASCARCHGAEGFVRYLAQQQGAPGVPGNPGNLADMSGLSADTIHPQTCQTCHDPHSTELRLEGDTGLLAGAFRYAGAGEGALCMVCHNGRSGSARYADGDLTAYTGIHVSAETDVFAGRNAFFHGVNTAEDTADKDNLAYKSAHSFMANACADCHVKWVPEDVKSQFKVAKTNHTFKASLEVCAECHAPGIGERVQEQAEEKLHTLATGLGLLYQGKLNGGGGPVTVTANPVDEHGEPLEDPACAPAACAETVTIENGSVQRIELSEFHGRPSLTFTLRSGKAHVARVQDFMREGVALFPVTTADQKTMAKAFYNYLLVHGAGGAVHNPAFVNGVLDATITAVKGVTTP